MSDALHEVEPAYGQSRRPSGFQPPIDELYREEVLAARKMSAEEKFLAGEALFELACSLTLAGIRNEHPLATEEECQKKLRQTIAARERADWITPREACYE